MQAQTDRSGEDKYQGSWFYHLLIYEFVYSQWLYPCTLKTRICYVKN